MNHTLCRLLSLLLLLPSDSSTHRRAVRGALARSQEIAWAELGTHCSPKPHLVSMDAPEACNWRHPVAVPAFDIPGTIRPSRTLHGTKTPIHRLKYPRTTVVQLLQLILPGASDEKERPSSCPAARVGGPWRHSLISARPHLLADASQFVRRLCLSNVYSKTPS